MLRALISGSRPAPIVVRAAMARNTAMTNPQQGPGMLDFGVNVVISLTRFQHMTLDCELVTAFDPPELRIKLPSALTAG
jgi:hypothetical protein